MHPFDLLVLEALAAAGFALLIMASPLGKLRFKPFACATCLTGWGAITAALLLGVPAEVGGWPERAIVFVLAATALGRLVLALAGQRLGPHPAPPPDEMTAVQLVEVEETDDGRAG